MALAIRQLVRRSSTVASIDSWILMDVTELELSSMVKLRIPCLQCHSVVQLLSLDSTGGLATPRARGNDWPWPIGPGSCLVEKLPNCFHMFPPSTCQDLPFVRS